MDIGDTAQQIQYIAYSIQHAAYGSGCVPGNDFVQVQCNTMAIDNIQHIAIENIQDAGGCQPATPSRAPASCSLVDGPVSKFQVNPKSTEGPHPILYLQDYIMELNLVTHMEIPGQPLRAHAGSVSPEGSRPMGDEQGPSLPGYPARSTAWQ